MYVCMFSSIYFFHSFPKAYSVPAAGLEKLRRQCHRLFYPVRERWLELRRKGCTLCWSREKNRNTVSSGLHTYICILLMVVCRIHRINVHNNNWLLSEVSQVVCIRSDQCKLDICTVELS